MNLFSATGLSVGISSLLLATIALIYGSKKLHRLLLFFNLAVAGWGVGLFLIGGAINEDEAKFGWRVASIGALIGPTFYHLICEFCELKKQKVVSIFYGLALISLILTSFTNYSINEFRYVFDTYFLKINLIFEFSFFAYFIPVIVAYIELIKYFPYSKGTKRTQTLYVIFGFLFGFLGGTSTFLPIHHIDIFHPAGNLGITVYACILTYAILRHRLMDIHVVVRQTVGYSIAVAITSGLFVVLVIVLTKMLALIIEVQSFTVTIIAAMIIAIIFNPLKMGIESFVVRIFKKTKEDYSHIIKKSSQKLSSSLDFENIQRLIVDTIFSALRLKSAVFLTNEGSQFLATYVKTVANGSKINETYLNSTFSARPNFIDTLKEKKGIIFKNELLDRLDGEDLKATEDYINQFNGEVVVPIFFDNELNNIILLGGKISGGAITDDDLNMIATITNQAGISFKNATLVRKVLHQEKLAAVGLVSSSIVHEFGNPIFAIRNLINGLLQLQKDEQQRDYLKSILLECDRLKILIDNLRNINRPSTEQTTLVDLNEIIADVLFLFHNNDDHDILVKKDLDENLPVVPAIENQIKQVILNLYINSRDALSGKNGGIINLKTEKMGADILFSITDSGDGISDKDLNTIFEPFVTTKQEGTGTGLGLSISKDIIGKHYGKIWAKSKRGKGSTFSFTLPVKN